MADAGKSLGITEYSAGWWCGGSPKFAGSFKTGHPTLILSLW
jgi:hypothetical protein